MPSRRRQPLRRNRRCVIARQMAVEYEAMAVRIERPLMSRPATLIQSVGSDADPTGLASGMGGKPTLAGSADGANWLVTDANRRNRRPPLSPSVRHAALIPRLSVRHGAPAGRPHGGRTPYVCFGKAVACSSAKPMMGRHIHDDCRRNRAGLRGLFAVKRRP